MSLTEQKYFDDTPVPSTRHHTRSTDPAVRRSLGQGTGGPGYGFDNEYPTTATRLTIRHSPCLPSTPRGTLAMANSGKPGSNGSQFFLVYEDSVLPPNYTVFGKIDDAGLATIEKIAADGDDGGMGATGGGAPNTPDHHRDCSSRLTPLCAFINRPRLIKRTAAYEAEVTR